MHNEKPHLPSKSLNSHVAAILVLLSSTFHLPPSTCFFFYVNMCTVQMCKYYKSCHKVRALPGSRNCQFKIGNKSFNRCRAAYG